MDLFNNKASFEVGNERRVESRKDKYCGEEPMYVSFPSSYVLVTSKEACMMDLWNETSVGCH